MTHRTRPRRRCSSGSRTSRWWRSSSRAPSPTTASSSPQLRPAAPWSRWASSCARRASPRSSPATAPASCGCQVTPGEGVTPGKRRRSRPAPRRSATTRARSTRRSRARRRRSPSTASTCRTCSQSLDGGQRGAGDDRPLQPGRLPPRRRRQLRPRHHADVRPMVSESLRRKAFDHRDRASEVCLRGRRGHVGISRAQQQVQPVAVRGLDPSANSAANPQAALPGRGEALLTNSSFRRSF